MREFYLRHFKNPANSRDVFTILGKYLAHLPVFDSQCLVLVSQQCVPGSVDICVKIHVQIEGCRDVFKFHANRE